MSKYKYLFWDVDGTVLNFEAAERVSIMKLFEKYGFGECTAEMLSNYSKINRKYWQALERGEMTKPEILIGRFNEFLGSLGLDTSKAADFNADYQLALGDTIVFCDEADEILKSEKVEFVIAAITNGTEIAQNKKLGLSGLDKVFDYIFISEVVGFEKPDKRFFEIALEKAGATDLSEVLIIGDSLTSDIQGGINMGIDTCWYNPKKVVNDKEVKPTYEVADLHEIEGIIK